MAARTWISLTLAACVLCLVPRLLASTKEGSHDAVALGLPETVESAAPVAGTLEPEQASPEPCTDATCTSSPSPPTGRSRVVFSITTMPRRLPLMKPVLDAVVAGQTRLPDAVYLALPPGVGELPGWLERYNETSKRPGVLKVLHMAADYGPASKLLAALREGGEHSPETIVIYGDDDILYGSRVVDMHVKEQEASTASAAFGTRRIGIGQGKRRQEILEATGSVSIRASVLPEEAFRVGGMPDTCRLSDDFWLSHYLTRAGVKLELLPDCIYDFHENSWPASCGSPFRTVPEIEHLGALSSVQVDAQSGQSTGSEGDWRDQLRRYELCQSLLLG